jgi:hypothetical protein
MEGAGRFGGAIGASPGPEAAPAASPWTHGAVVVDGSVFDVSFFFGVGGPTVSSFSIFDISYDYGGTLDRKPCKEAAGEE